VLPVAASRHVDSGGLDASGRTGRHLRTHKRSHSEGAVTDEYLTLQQLAAYSKVSARQLRKYLALSPGLALPCYRYGRNRLVVRRSEFDAWFSQYRQRGKSVLARVLRDLGLDRTRVPDTRKPLASVGRATRAAPLQADERTP
jgi:hypothetical protein